MTRVSIRYWQRLKRFLVAEGLVYVKPEGDWNGTAVYEKDGTRVKAEFVDIEPWGVDGREVPRHFVISVEGAVNERISAVLDFLSR